MLRFLSLGFGVSSQPRKDVRTANLANLTNKNLGSYLRSSAVQLLSLGTLLEETGVILGVDGEPVE